MPSEITLPPPCKVCGTGRPLPADATFCPNCGRPAASAAAAGRLAVAWVVGIGFFVLLLLGVGVMLIVAGTSPRTRRVVAAVHAPPAAPAGVAPRAPAVVAAPPPPTGPANDPTDGPVPGPSDPPVVVTATTRPGDTDLTVDPLAAYAGGPPADRLSIRGLRLGLPLAAVPVALLDVSAPDHLRDAFGNLYAVDDRVISEVHILDPDLLAHWPIDSVNALVGHFGEPGDVYRGDGNDAFPTYLYPDRGIHVRWDNAAGRVIEVVLVRPRPAGGGG